MMYVGEEMMKVKGEKIGGTSHLLPAQVSLAFKQIIPISKWKTKGSTAHHMTRPVMDHTFVDPHLAHI